MSPAPHFLDTLPFDWSRPESQALLRTLLAAYPTQPEALALATSAGVDPSEIAVYPKLRLTWIAIIDEARMESKLRRMIDAVLDDPRKASIHERLRALLGPEPVAEVPESRSAEGEPVIEARWNGDEKLAEKILGARSTLVDTVFLERGLQAARAVARLEMRFHRGRFAGTGFLITPDLVLTAYHNLFDLHAGEERVLEVRTWFDYEIDTAGQLRPVIDIAAVPASILGSREDDWAVLRLSRPPGYTYRPVTLAPEATLTAGDAVHIVQHPAGTTKKVGLRPNALVFVDATRVQYLTDTEPGASGSPVFNDQWEVVAVHHSGGDLPIAGTDRRAFRNEGTRISQVVSGLRARGRWPG